MSHNLIPLALTWALALAAFSLCAMGMERHSDDFALPTPLRPHARYLPWAGQAALLLALVPCWLRWPPALAILAWLGVLSFAALSLGLMLTYRPAQARHCLPAALALAAVLGIMRLTLL